jgi:hypothetical protein
MTKIEEKIHFYTLNVGQGDSHVIHFPTQKAAIIIDPGNGALLNELLNNHLKIKHLPLILISHFDLDHMRGLNSVIQKCIEGINGSAIRPGYIFFSDQGFGKSVKSKTIADILDDFEQLAEEHSLKFEYSIADNSSSRVFIDILKDLGIEGRIVYPKRLQQKEAFKKNDYNLASVLLYLIFSNKKILYTGDLPYKGWKNVTTDEDLTSDVFKVPHHGGKISPTPGKDTCKILERVNPNFALISVGSTNRYKHPIPEVVDALITHETSPHLFCTQMTKKCCSDENIKEKIENFYEKEIEDLGEKKILKLGSHKGSLCAGTIRVTFDNKKRMPYTSPQVFTHLHMLETLFNTNQLLCKAQF